MYQLFFYLLFLSFFLTSCLWPLRSFEKTNISSAPDYSQEKYWACLPEKKDSSDIVPYTSNLKDEQSAAMADVFFIYPTIYLAGTKWNADVNNRKLNKRIDKSTIRHQATVFNGCCKIYVPRYRQAVLYSYAKMNGSGKKALDFAYEDVKKAFEYYLKHYNRGRPIIIASHSQGTGHAEKLLRDYFDNDSLMRKKLITAYLIGGDLKKNAFKNIPSSDSASQTGCYIGWNAKKWGKQRDNYYSKDIECVNPLTWKRDTVTGGKAKNLGSVPYGFTRIDISYADAKVSPEGILWVHKEPKKGYTNGKNYHVLDYNLFWMNIRENAKLRVEIYLQKNK